MKNRILIIILIDLLKTLSNSIDYNQQFLDELSFRLIESVPNLLKFKGVKLEFFDMERLNPIKIIEYHSLELMHEASNMAQYIKLTLKNYEDRSSS